jgi:hypothetical protein
MNRRQKERNETATNFDIVIHIAMIALLSYCGYLFISVLSTFFMDMALVSGFTKGLTPSSLETLDILAFSATMFIGYYIGWEKL